MPQELKWICLQCGAANEGCVCEGNEKTKEIIKLKAQIAELMEPKTIGEDNPWSMRENGHYGLDLFYGEVGIAHLSEKAYAQLVEYMSSFAMKEESRDIGGE